jgi:uncharacterized membrane protein YjdF
MKEGLKLKILFYFTVGYILFFTVLSILSHNYEFLYYTFIMACLIWFVSIYYKKFRLPVNVIEGLVLLGALHVLGGNLVIDGVRLYEMVFGILRYDNIVHIVGGCVATLVAYSFLYPHLDKKLYHNKFFLSILLVLIALGIGAVNELVELFAVVFFNAADRVGDYMNNAVDIVYNFLGSVVACIYLVNYKIKKR